MLKGQCLCGDIQFETEGDAKGPAVCHCGLCRRQSGHVWASVNVVKSDLTVHGDVKWFEASPSAKRGFCPRCGSFLFWTAHDEDTISVALGAIDIPTGLKLERHIFVADKGDYYDISDDLPQLERS